MTDLAELLHDRLDAVPVPPGDLQRVERRGRGIRRRRTLPLAVGAAVLVALAGYALRPGGGDHRSDHGADPIGRLELGDGLRAYADFGVTFHLGSTELPYRDLADLDTRATATPGGLLYYERGTPLLLDESGQTRSLEPDADPRGSGLAAKMDAQEPWVAYNVVVGDQKEVVVRDTETWEEVARRSFADDAVVDAVDAGVVMVRDAHGTTAWDVDADTVQLVAGPATQVVDLRGGTLLFDGPRPDGPGAAPYRLVAGATDARLTFDGGHLLSWSRRLESIDGGPPVVLAQDGTFFAVDTDGSILVAAGRDGGGSTIYDCPVSGEACARIGSTTNAHGDPEFIGNDE